MWNYPWVASHQFVFAGRFWLGKTVQDLTLTCGGLCQHVLYWNLRSGIFLLWQVQQCQGVHRDGGPCPGKATIHVRMVGEDKDLEECEQKIYVVSING